MVGGERTRSEESWGEIGRDGLMGAWVKLRARLHGGVK